MSISLNRDSMSVSTTGGRRGRGFRTVLIPPHLPGYKTRRECFDDLVVQAASLVREVIDQVKEIEFAVEEIPPSDPSPWETPQAVLGRLFPADKLAKLPARIVLYRLPIQMRCPTFGHLKAAIMQVIVENVGEYLEVSVEEIMNRLAEKGYQQ